MSSIDAVPPRARLPRRLLTLFASAIVIGGLFAALPSTAEAQWCGTNDCPGYANAISAITVVHADPGLTNDTPVEPDTGETIEVGTVQKRAWPG